MYFGAVQNMSSNETKRQLGSIQALFGSEGVGKGDHVLQHIINEAAQPESMSPSQISSVTKSIANCQCELPNKVVLKMMQSDITSAGMYLGLARSFESNGIQVLQSRGTPPNPIDSGILIEVDNTGVIPDFALRLHSMLDLAALPSKVVQRSKSDSEEGFHVFIAPR